MFRTFGIHLCLANSLESPYCPTKYLFPVSGYLSTLPANLPMKHLHLFFTSPLYAGSYIPECPNPLTSTSAPCDPCFSPCRRGVAGVAEAWITSCLWDGFDDVASIAELFRTALRLTLITTSFYGPYRTLKGVVVQFELSAVVSVGAKIPQCTSLLQPPLRRPLGTSAAHRGRVSLAKRGILYSNCAGFVSII